MHHKSGQEELSISMATDMKADMSIVLHVKSKVKTVRQIRMMLLVCGVLDQVISRLESIIRLAFWTLVSLGKLFIVSTSYRQHLKNKPLRTKKKPWVKRRNVGKYLFALKKSTRHHSLFCLLMLQSPTSNPTLLCRLVCANKLISVRPYHTT